MKTLVAIMTAAKETVACILGGVWGREQVAKGQERVIRRGKSCVIWCLGTCYLLTLHFHCYFAVL